MTPISPHPEEFRRVGEGEDGTTFVCGLCGTRFTHGGQVCGRCPLRRGCELVSCPNCGYQFPRSSKLIDWLKSRWRARRAELDVRRGRA